MPLPSTTAFSIHSTANCRRWKCRGPLEIHHEAVWVFHRCARGRSTVNEGPSPQFTASCRRAVWRRQTWKRFGDRTFDLWTTSRTPAIRSSAAHSEMVRMGITTRIRRQTEPGDLESELRFNDGD